MAVSMFTKAAVLGGVAYLLTRSLRSSGQGRRLWPAPATPPQRQPDTGFPQTAAPPAAQGGAGPAQVRDGTATADG